MDRWNELPGDILKDDKKALVLFPEKRLLTSYSSTFWSKKRKEKKMSPFATFLEAQRKLKLAPGKHKDHSLKRGRRSLEAQQDEQTPRFATSWL